MMGLASLDVSMSTESHSVPRTAGRLIPGSMDLADRDVLGAVNPFAWRG